MMNTDTEILSLKLKTLACSQFFLLAPCVTLLYKNIIISYFCVTILVKNLRYNCVYVRAGTLCIKNMSEKQQKQQQRVSETCCNMINV